ncbi:MAG TPA: ATP synthase F1 subunit delta [Actinomycetota bacterium]
MGTGDVVQGYARALFAAAESEGVLDRVGDELYAFARAMDQNPALREALTDAALPADRRKAVVADLLGDRALPLSTALVGFVIDAGHARDLGKIIDELARVAAHEREHELAEVRTAVALTDQQRDRLAAALSEATGRRVEVKVVVDDTVVGGVIARVGDLVFDGSVASRLEGAKHALGS